MMEKTTNRTERLDDGGWLRLAIGVLARTAESDLLTGDEGAAERTPGSSLRRPRRRAGQAIVPRTGFSLHHHPRTELCLALSGRAALQLGEQVYPFHPPRMAVIPPGLSHMEGRTSPRQPYVILWLSPSPKSLLMHASRHRPGQGWDSAWRFVLPEAAAGRIARLANTDSTPSAALLLAELLAALSEAHRDVIRRTTPPVSPHEALLDHVQSYLDTHLAEPVTLAQVAAIAGFTPNHLNTLFRRRMGKGIHAYLVARRMERARTLCQRGDLLVKQVAAAVGYPDPLYFSRAFHRHHGLWPSECGPTCRRE